MVPQVKELVTEPNDLPLIPGIHIKMEGQNGFHKVAL